MAGSHRLTSPLPPNTPPAQPAPVASRRKPPTAGRLALFAAGVVVGGFVGFGIGAGSSSDSTATAAVATPTATRTVTVTPKAQATRKPKPLPSPITVEDGVWTVGEDIKAGTYKLAEPVTGHTCYWTIYRSGSNQSHIIQIDAVQGGRPTVTLRAGQDFDSQTCGTWERQ